MQKLVVPYLSLQHSLSFSFPPFLLLLCFLFPSHLVHVATPPVSIIPDPSALQLLAMVTQPPQTQHLSQNMSLPSPPPLSQHPYPTSNESNHPSLSFYIHDRAPQATTKSMIAPVQHTLTFLTTLSHNSSDPHHHQPRPFLPLL